MDDRTFYQFARRATGAGAPRPCPQCAANARREALKPGAERPYPPMLVPGATCRICKFLDTRRQR
jgi:hypothetical protein